MHEGFDIKTLQENKVLCWILHYYMAVAFYLLSFNKAESWLLESRNLMHLEDAMEEEYSSISFHQKQLF